MFKLTFICFQYITKQYAKAHSTHASKHGDINTSIYIKTFNSAVRISIKHIGISYQNNYRQKDCYGKFSIVL